MFPRLRSVAAGVAAVATLVVSAACGLPDAGPAVEQMRAQAAERGFGGHLRYSAVSIGGLGTAPWVRSEGPWEADEAEFRELLTLLQDNERINEEHNGAGFNVKVDLQVNGTDVGLTTVPDTPTGEILTQIPGPGVTRLSLDGRGNLGVGAEPDAHDRLATLAPRMHQAGLARLSVGDNRAGFSTTFDLGPATTPEFVTDTLRTTGDLAAALAPDEIRWVSVAGHITGLEVRTADFRADNFTPLTGAVPAGTALTVVHDNSQRTFRLRAGGGDVGGAADDGAEEAALREVVEQ